VFIASDAAYARLNQVKSFFQSDCSPKDAEKKSSSFVQSDLMESKSTKASSLSSNIIPSKASVSGGSPT